MAADAQSEGNERASGASQSLRRVRSGIGFSFFNAMTWQVALGTPMVLFAERLGASAAAVGLAYSFVFMLTPLQVLATSYLPRLGYKRMMLIGWGARSVFLLPPVVLAWMRPDPSLAVVAIFIGSLFMFTVWRSIGACAWLPWINALLRSGNRGRYFATDQVASGISGVGTLILCWWTLRALELERAFLLQYSFAFVGSWLAYLALARLPDAPRPSALPLADVLRDSPRLVLAPGSYRSFLIVCVLAGVAVSAIPPFCAYYLKVVPRVPASEVLSYTVAQYTGVIVSAFLMRNLVDRFGARPFLQLAMVVYTVVALYWLAILRGLAPGGAPLLGIYALLGVAAACWSTGLNSYLPLVVDPERRTLAYSVQSATVSLASGLSPIVWGLFIKGAGTLPSVDVGAFTLFFVAVVAAAGVVLLLVWRLPQEAGAGGGMIVGGVLLRPFRGITYLASLVLPSGEKDDAPASADETANGGAHSS